MGNYIKSANVNIQNGLLVESISFGSGLNLLSGENGTLKTKLLQALKTDVVQFHDPATSCRRQAISPKRNAMRRAFSQICAEFRRNDTKLEALVIERNINDSSFESYPALGDLFYVVYEDLCRDGGNQKDKMRQATEEFNRVIQQIFPHYELRAEWNGQTGIPTIELFKNQQTHVPLEGLSLGEQEVLSLAANLYSSRRLYDVFLIDEPEVHLNWHLEERLFEFFDTFCDENEKQMVVVTHSRVIFKQRFFSKSQFLFWNDSGTVSISRDITSDQRERIAGDAIEVMRLGAFSKATIFVEDSCHALVLRELAACLSVDIAISECGSKSNLRSLFQFSQTDGEWAQCFFLEDGDNEGSPYPRHPRFFHLDKYCMETYLLDTQIIAGISGKSEAAILKSLLQAIMANKEKIFRRNKFFEFLVDQLRVEHLTPENISKLDASEVIATFRKDLFPRMGLQQYVHKYISECSVRGRLREVFPAAIIDLLEGLGAAK